MRRTESYFNSIDGLRLYFQEWTPENAKLHLVITHGLGEHSDCYEDFVAGLADCGYRISAWDLRGHGRSQGARGSAKGMEQFEQDLEFFLSHVLEIEKSPVPVVLFGHSMGGLILLKTLLGLDRFRRLPLVLSSPFLGPSLPVPDWKLNTSKILSQTLPELTLDNEISEKLLTRDPRVIQRYQKDPLRHSRISSGFFEGALQAIETVFFRAKYYRGDILTLVSDQDPVVSTENIKMFFEHLDSKKELCLFENRKHEVFNDLGNEEAFESLRKFLSLQSETRQKRRPYLA